MGEVVTTMHIVRQGPQGHHAGRLGWEGKVVENDLEREGEQVIEPRSGWTPLDQATVPSAPRPFLSPRLTEAMPRCFAYWRGDDIYIRCWGFWFMAKFVGYCDDPKQTKRPLRATGAKEAPLALKDIDRSGDDIGDIAIVEDSAKKKEDFDDVVIVEDLAKEEEDQEDAAWTIISSS
jgi:hypothetical protein